MNKYIVEVLKQQKMDIVDLGKAIDMAGEMAQWRYPKKCIVDKSYGADKVIRCPTCSKKQDMKYVHDGCFCARCGQALLGVDE